MPRLKLSNYMFNCRLQSKHLDVSFWKHFTDKNSLLLFFFFFLIKRSSDKHIWKRNWLGHRFLFVCFFYPQASPLKRKIDYRPVANSSFPNLEHWEFPDPDWKVVTLTFPQMFLPKLAHFFSSIAIAVCTTHFSTMHCPVFWFTSIICSFIQRMLNEESLICVRWVRQGLWPLRAYSSYISLPPEMTGSWKKNTSSFSHMLLHRGAHIAAFKTHQPYQIDAKRALPDERGVGPACLVPSPSS